MEDTAPEQLGPETPFTPPLADSLRKQLKHVSLGSPPIPRTEGAAAALIPSSSVTPSVSTHHAPPALSQAPPADPQLPLHRPHLPAQSSSGNSCPCLSERRPHLVPSM